MDISREKTQQAVGRCKPEDSWVQATCVATGSKDPECGLPSDAVAAVRQLMIEMTGMTQSDDSVPRLTKVDAQLLEAWQHKAGDPDGQVGRWLKCGAHSGILNPLWDPGLFPTTDRPAELLPEQLHCDELQFRNYAGVEEQQITDQELS